MEEEDNAEDISTYFSKGQQFLEMNRIQEALSLFNEIIIKSKKKGDQDSLSKGYYYVGICLKQIGKIEDSFEKLYKSFEHGVEAGSWSISDKAFTEIIGLGLVKEKRGHYNLLLKKYFERGNSFLLNGNYKESIASYTLLINNGSLLENWEFVAKAYINMGFIFIDIGKHKDAISLLEKAITYSEKAKYTEGIGNAYLNIGFAYSNLNVIDKAIDALKKAVTCCEILKIIK